MRQCVTSAREVLRRIRSGDEGSGDAAVALAEAVLADAAVILALDVLDGGPVRRRSPSPGGAVTAGGRLDVMAYLSREVPPAMASDGGPQVTPLPNRSGGIHQIAPGLSRPPGNGTELPLSYRNLRTLTVRPFHRGSP